MSDTIQSVRGMTDSFDRQVHDQNHVIQEASRQALQCNFVPVTLPLVEKTELFRRAVGTATDIVEKEMYTFVDRNGSSLSLRPEGTAGCIRAAIENSWIQQGQEARLFYHGAMFRRERPQLGRYRQFHQFGCEQLGSANPLTDAELIVMTARLWRHLGINDAVSLEVNCLGNRDDRQRYKSALLDFLEPLRSTLDEDSQRRLDINPLRTLDSKDPRTAELLKKAPKLSEYLSKESQKRYETMIEAVDQCGVNWQHNAHLVRGLDYYNDAVFEWTSQSLGAQAAICAGGRYDGLMEQLGGRKTPASGFAIGLERVMQLIAQSSGANAYSKPKVWLVCGHQTGAPALVLADEVRSQTSWVVGGNFDGASYKSQFRKADKSGAVFALILGDQETQSGTVSVCFLRDDKPQLNLPREKLVQFLEDSYRAFHQ